MVEALAQSWSDLVRHRIFPPPCSRPDCRSARLLRRRPPIRIQDAWVCSVRCMEFEVRTIFDRLAFALRTAPRPVHRVPLGLLMLAHGNLDASQLQAALNAQREAQHGKLGAWLQALHVASEQQVVSALGVQWACPPLQMRGSPDLDCSALLPFVLLQTLHLMPVRLVAATRLLYIAVSEGVDYPVLSAIEQVIGFRTVPCLVSDRVMQNLLERASASARSVQLFDRVTDAAESSRITSSYIAKLGAEEVRIVRCGPYFWARLKHGNDFTDLFFTARRLAEGAASDTPVGKSTDPSIAASTTLPVSLPAI
jgi:hypothetical protein